MKFLSNHWYGFRAVLMAMAFCAVTSCDKVTNLIDKFKKDGKETTISQEELEKSDAAVMKYLNAMEEIPLILAKVRDEKTAFEARKKLDTLSREVSVIVVDLVQIDGDEAKKMLQTRAKPAPPKAKAKKTRRSKEPVARQKSSAPEVKGQIYWYILEENTVEYEARVKKLGTRVQSQLIRIARITQDSAVAFDVIFDGILTLASVEAGGEAPNENPVDVVKPMSKDWLPPGVTRE